MEKSESKNKFISKLLTVYRTPLVLLVLIIIASLISSDFLSFNNIMNIIRQVSVIGILAGGMTFVILTGGIDLSVGAILGLSGAISAFVLNGLAEAGFNNLTATILAILIGLLVGLLSGVFNGLFITMGDLPPFIVTLATMTLFNGLLLVFTGGAPISIMNPLFRTIGKGRLLSIPVPIFVLIIVYAIAFLVLHYTKFGRSTYALGGNKEAARLSGINVKKIELLVYSISGLLAGLGGVLLTARLGSGQPTAGSGYELDAIAAVILGGTSLSGGNGFVLPTIVGALILGILDNILVLMNVNPFISNVVKGVVILLAVLVDKRFKNLSLKIES